MSLKILMGCFTFDHFSLVVSNVSCLATVVSSSLGWHLLAYARHGRDEAGRWDHFSENPFFVLPAEMGTTVFELGVRQYHPSSRTDMIRERLQHPSFGVGKSQSETFLSFGDEEARSWTYPLPDVGYIHEESRPHYTPLLQQRNPGVVHLPDHLLSGLFVLP